MDTDRFTNLLFAGQVTVAVSLKMIVLVLICSLISSSFVLTNQLLSYLRRYWYTSGHVHRYLRWS